MSAGVMVLGPWIASPYKANSTGDGFDRTILGAGWGVWVRSVDDVWLCSTSGALFRRTQKTHYERSYDSADKAKLSMDELLRTKGIVLVDSPSEWEKICLLV